MLILFALLVPLLLGLGSIVLSVGNWYVHKRHLQTQVDAAVLAAAPDFTDCFLEGASANADIKDQALKYAGDTLRDPTTRNLQEQEPNDVRVALNSTRYWAPSDGLNTVTGYDLDWTMDGDTSTAGNQSSLPCDASFLEAKATDQEVPLIWRWLPAYPSPKAKARLEIKKSRSVSGFLPWAVPENNPRTVAALFVDEGANGNGADTVSNFALLTPPASTTTLNGEPVALWSGLASIPVVEQTGVVVFQSRQLLDQTYFTGKTLSELCDPALKDRSCFGSIRNQNPSVSNRTGVAFVHGEGQTEGAGGGRSVIVNTVELSVVPNGGRPSGGNPCSDDSSPYFNWTAEDCDVRIRALVDFSGPGWAPASREVRVSTSPFGNRCSGGILLDRNGAWWEQERSWTTIAAGSGRNLFYLCWYGETGNPPNQQSWEGSWGGRAQQMAFAVNTDPGRSNTAYSGPIVYLKVLPTPSMPQANQGATIEVGLQPALARTSNPAAQPVMLRIAGTGSLNQMLDCDPSPRQPVDEIYSGCETPYQRNTRGLVCAPTWDTNNLPPTGQVDGPSWVDPDCIEANPGDVTALAKGLHDRFEAPAPGGADCSRNAWVDFRTSGEIPPVTDKRYITLVIAEYAAFEKSGITVIPITKFAGFYATGWFIGGGANGTLGCPDNDPPPTTTLCKQGRNFRPCTASDNAVQGAVWGYFVTTVPFAPRPRPSDEFCVFSDPDQCVAVLVE